MAEPDLFLTVEVPVRMEKAQVIIAGPCAALGHHMNRRPLIGNLAQP
jgi:hypothetical protein